MKISWALHCWLAFSTTHMASATNTSSAAASAVEAEKPPSFGHTLHADTGGKTSSSNSTAMITDKGRLQQQQQIGVNGVSLRGRAPRRISGSSSKGDTDMTSCG